MLGSFFVAC